MYRWVVWLILCRIIDCNTSEVIGTLVGPAPEQLRHAEDPLSAVGSDHVGVDPRLGTARTARRTVVVIMGERGCSLTVNKNAGRDHWPQCGFSLFFGGGTKRGFVLGETDKHARYPIERPVSAGYMAATIYDPSGVDSDMTVNDLSARPVPISHGGQSAQEVMA